MGLRPTLLEIAMPSPISGVRRSNIEIVQDILMFCDKGGARKTAMMHRCGLNHGQLRRYLSFLSDEGLLENDGSGHFETTPDGRKARRLLSRASKAVQGLRDY